MHVLVRQGIRTSIACPKRAEGIVEGWLLLLLSGRPGEQQDHGKFLESKSKEESDEREVLGAVVVRQTWRISRKGREVEWAVAKMEQGKKEAN
jgi:hypothetical protein